MNIKLACELYNKSIPFFFIGLFCGLIMLIDPYLAPNGIVYSYLRFSKISIDLSEQAGEIINEHIAIGSILFFVILLMFFSFIHRAIFGCNNETFFYKKMLRPVEDFLLSLNGALIGLFSGVCLVSLIEWVFLDGVVKVPLAFAFFCFYPFAFSLLVFVSRNIVSERFYIGRNYLGRLGDMIEGMFLICMAILLLTFHVNFIDFFQSAPERTVRFIMDLFDYITVVS
ncbi:hypothetical protein [Aeromonas salmonicida]|uniref:hypothetical protein n=1 Tax=Aeromonas salmonicida TaxID=645 RepID=UPI003D31E7A7